MSFFPSFFPVVSDKTYSTQNHTNNSNSVTQTQNQHQPQLLHQNL